MTRFVGILLPWLVALAAGPTPVASQQAPRAGPHLAQVDGLPEPRGMDVDEDGRFYVTLSGADAVVVLDGSGQTLARWGTSGTAPGQLSRPTGLALAPEGRLFVAEAATHRIQRFTRGGRFERAFGGPGHAPGQLSDPGGLCFADGRLYVADTGNHRVTVFDADGELLEILGSHGSARDELRFPADVAVDELGTLFIADRGNDRIVRRTRDGTLSVWGDRGPYPGLFLAPSALCWAGSRLYVADREAHRIQVFDGDGARLYEWGLHALRPREGQGALHYPDGLAVLAGPGPAELIAAVSESLEDRVQLFGVSRDEAGNYAADPTLRSGLAPHYGPAATAAGELLVLTEPETRSVLIFDLRSSQPVAIHRLGGSGDKVGRFLDVTDVCLAPDGKTLYVVDRAARRLSAYRVDHDLSDELHFDPELTHLVWSLDLAARLGREVEPLAVAVAANGTLYLAEALGPSILVIDERLRLARVLNGPHSGRGAPRLGLPLDLALSPDDRVLYVADAAAGRVWALGLDGRPIPGRLPGATPSASRACPSGVAVDASGRLVVVDRSSHQVRVRDGNGQLLAAWGERGLGASAFFKPRGVAIDGRGRVHVVDHGNHRLMTFDIEGTFLGAFGPRVYVLPTRDVDPAPTEET